MSDLIEINIEVRIDTWKELQQKEKLLEILKEFDIKKLTWEEK